MPVTLPFYFSALSGNNVMLTQTYSLVHKCLCNMHSRILQKVMLSLLTSQIPYLLQRICIFDCLRFLAHVLFSISLRPIIFCSDCKSCIPVLSDSLLTQIAFQFLLCDICYTLLSLKITFPVGRRKKQLSSSAFFP